MGTHFSFNRLFNVRTKSSVLILCILVLNDQILNGLCANSAPSPAEREIEIEYEHRKPTKDDDDDDYDSPGKRGDDNDGDSDEDGNGNDGDPDEDGNGNDDGDRDGEDDDDDGPGKGGKGKGGKGKDGTDNDNYDEDYVDDEDQDDEDENGKGSKRGGVNKDGTVNQSPDGLPNRPFPEAPGRIGTISGTGRRRIRKNTMGGLARILDDRLLQLDRYGDPHVGMPEDALGHAVYCAQFIYSGLFALVFIHIRWPLKIVSKVILYTGAISHLVAYANRCLNPITIMDFVSAGKKHNAHIERMAEFKDRHKKQTIWITDHAKHKDRQMYYCCSLHEYFGKTYVEAPEIKWFSQRYFIGLYQLPILCYCMQYQAGSQACEETDLSVTDQDPDRIVPMSMLTVVLEMMGTFI